MTRTRSTINYLRQCQATRAKGYKVAFTTDPAWLVNQAINRRAGWFEDLHTRGTTQPINGRFPRKARGDYLRHLWLISREVNTPRLRIRVARLGEHRWLVERLPNRFTSDDEAAVG
jgi:hypothetical protein